ncbi:MAG: uroporphyrinogen-III synthase [Sphingobacteriales bacterium]|nr:MAG: uroporphyrinogen-III synthase [Sphingobacteriales bacterium]
MSTAIRILSTKLLREATMRQFAAAGIEVVTKPFIRIDIPGHITLPDVQKADAIITSANALNALVGIRHKLPPFHTIYCIAGRTETMVSATFEARIIARPYALELVDVLVNTEHIYPLWFFKGDKALPTIPEGLAKNGILFSAIEVYQNTAIPHVLKEHFDAILFFSPTAVESFREHNIIPDNTITFAVGKTTAGALKSFAKQVIISEVPSEAAVAEAVVKHFNF